MPTAPHTRLLDEATRLRSLGFGLCRILAGEKVPRYTGWTRATLEPADFRPHRQANLGILGGAVSNDLVIVDPDRPEIRLEAARRLPPTMTDGRRSSPTGHFYYRVTDVPAWAQAGANVAGGAGGPRIFHFTDADGKPIGLDFLGTGGQAVCPPSLHHSGERRGWVVGPEHIVTLPYVDLWAVVKQLAKDFGAANADREVVRPAADATGEPRVITDAVVKRAVAYLGKCPPAVSGEGGHNQTFKVARAVVWGFDLGADAGFDLLQQFYNPRCEPPWSDAELLHKCEDADCLPFGKPRGGLRGKVVLGVGSTGATGSGGDGLATTCLTDIHPEPVRWLVDGLFAVGKVALIAGDGGHGKSALTLALTAAITRGLPAFGLEYTPPPPGEVLLISCEDDYADTVVPRLLALGADRSKVHRVDGLASSNGKPEPFSLAHYENLERELEKRTDVRLVVIDPAGAYIGKAGCDDHRDSELRALLGPLAELAARRRVTVLLVKHLNKGTTIRAVNKVGGSTGYVNSVRSAFLVAPHPEDDERKLFLPLKWNCGARPRGFAYKFHPLPADEAAAILDIFAHLEAEDRERLQSQLFRPEYLGPADDDPNTVLGDAARRERGPMKVDQCTAWLEQFLAEFAYPSNEILAAAKEEGFTFDNLKEAKTKLKSAKGLCNSNRGRFQGQWWSGFGDSANWRLRPDPGGLGSDEPALPPYPQSPQSPHYGGQGVNAHTGECGERRETGERGECGEPGRPGDGGSPNPSDASAPPPAPAGSLASRIAASRVTTWPAAAPPPARSAALTFVY